MSLARSSGSPAARSAIADCTRTAKSEPGANQEVHVATVNTREPATVTNPIATNFSFDTEPTICVAGNGTSKAVHAESVSFAGGVCGVKADERIAAKYLSGGSGLRLQGREEGQNAYQDQCWDDPQCVLLVVCALNQRDCDTDAPNKSRENLRRKEAP